jgi:hypothetical protein
MAKATQPDAPITPDDLRAKFEALQDDVQGRVEDKKTSIAAVAAGGAVVLMLVFFLLGKRSGKKRSAIVEIRRV